jgi:hypothetical protein
VESRCGDNHFSFWCCASSLMFWDGGRQLPGGDLADARVAGSKVCGISGPQRASSR